MHETDLGIDFLRILGILRRNVRRMQLKKNRIRKKGKFLGIKKV